MLYGRRKGRSLNEHRQNLLDTLLPTIDLQKNLAHPLLAKFQKRWLEIGFGYGQHLIAQAQWNPDVLLIGCEPFVNGIAGTLESIYLYNLNNILIYPDDALIWLGQTPNNYLEKIFILFPDPWPKKRHHKRRLVSKDNLSLMAQKLEPHGQIILATDHPDYFEWMLEVVKDHPDFTYENPEDPLTPPAAWVATRFQQKAVHPAKFIFLRKG
jgi:tRNA (guanine-N7-)-methyltransferase